MSHRILIKRGLSSDLANAGTVDGELKYASDTKKLYIGNGNENVVLNDFELIDITSRCIFQSGYSNFCSRTRIFKLNKLLFVSYFIVPTSSSSVLPAGKAIYIPYQIESRVDNCGKVQNSGNGAFYTMGNIRLEDNYLYINDQQSYSSVCVFGQIFCKIVI